MDPIVILIQNYVRELMLTLLSTKNLDTKKKVFFFFFGLYLGNVYGDP